MRLFAIILLTALLYLPFEQLRAQDYIVNVQQFGIEEGLAHRHVIYQFKDKDGFLWSSTSLGLQRYDGYEFKFYPLPDTFKVSISKIGQDKDGWLILQGVKQQQASFIDLFFINPVTGAFKSKEERFGQETIATLTPFWETQKYHSFLQKGKNGIYFSNNQEINFFDFEKGLQKVEIQKHSNLHYLTKLIFIDQQGNFWLYENHSQAQIVKVSPKGERLASFPFQVSNEYCAVNEWEQNIYQIGREKVYQIDALNERKLLFQAPSGYNVHKFIDGFIWCIGEVGWKVFDISGALLFELNRKDYDRKLFDGLDFKNIISDGTGNFYLNTKFGFNIIEIQKNPFTTYFANDPKHPLPISNAARGIYADDDRLLVNFEFGGLVEISKNQNKDAQIISTISYPDIPEKGYSGYPLLMDSEQQLWSGHNIHLSQWSSDFSKEELISITKELDFEFENTWTIWEDEAGCIWTGYHHELAVFCEGDSLQTAFNIKDIGIDADRIMVYQFVPYQGEFSTSDATNEFVWLCTNNGLYLFDKVNKKVRQHYHENAKGTYTLPTNEIFQLHIDANQNKWLATRGGLVFWNTKTDEKRLFNRRNGLSNNVIYAVYEDNHNRLWLSSDYGIMSFDKETFAVKTYLPKDGIAQNEFNRISHFQDQQGNIYFGGLNGVTAFHPNDFLADKKHFAKVLISECELFDGTKGKVVDKIKELAETQVITIRPNDGYLKLKFTLPTFNNISKTLYAWKIDGVYEDWTYQKENTLQFGTLPYGNHTLQIKGQDAEGGWSPYELTLQVKVLKPFYLQTWFISLAILSFILGIYLFFKRRTQRFKETQKLLESEIKKATAQIENDKQTIGLQAEKLRQLDKVKSRFFANVSHELRTPLTLMLGPISSAIKSGQLNNKNFTLLKKAQQGGKDLLKLVGAILDLSKMEASKMEVHENPVFLFKLTRRITSAFESHAQREGITFMFKYEAEPTLQLNLDKEKVEIILNNLLSNAIKFTPKDKEIAVRVEDLSNVIKITVKDTGRGIHPDDLPYVFNRFYQSVQPDAPTEGGTGIGLALSQELITLMDGRLWVESELGKGSSFFVELPRTEVLGTVEHALPPKGEHLPTSPESALSLETMGSDSPLGAEGEKNQTLLIVEDNYSLRDYIATILAPHYNILTAENGQVALEILSASSFGNPLPSAVISDIMMPVMDGYQLLEKIKTDKKWLHLPVIMLTARADIQDKLKALRIGVDDYLLKPFDEEELLVRIENLLENRDNRNAFLIENETELVASNNEPKVSEENLFWLQELETTLMSKIEDTNYSLTEMSADFAMSGSTFTRQLKRLTGLTPIRYLQELRLNEARRILENREHRTIAKVAYQVGFKDANAFSRAFKKRFGKSPSDIIN